MSRLSQSDLEQLVCVLEDALAYLQSDEEVEVEPELAREHVEEALELLLPVRLDMRVAATNAAKEVA